MQEHQVVEFQVNGTIRQKILPVGDDSVDLVQMLRDGEAVTTLGSSGLVRSIPDLKVIGKITDVEVLEDTEYLDFKNSE